MTALEQLRDTFDGATAGPWNFGASTTGLGGSLTCTGDFSDALNSEPQPALRPGEAQSVAAYSLTGSFLAVELVELEGGASASAWAGLFTDTPRGTALLWWLEWNTGTGYQELTVRRRVAGVDTVLATAPYDPQGHRWLRVRESAGTLYWETSPDGFLWSQLVAAAPGMAVTALRVAMGTSYSSPGDVGARARFDNVNVLPWESDRPTITGQEGDPYLAVDVQPDYAVGTFVLDASQLDGPDRLAWSDTDPGSWASIVCDVMQLNYRRGAARLQGLFTQVEAGTATLKLSDTLHAFDPLVNAESVHKGTPLRVRAWGYDAAGQRWDAVLFTAEVDDVGVQYLKADAPVVTITVVDLVGVLNAWQSEGSPQPGLGAGETLRARAARVLATVGRGELSTASDTVYSTTLAPTVMARPWQELNSATEAELGRVWVDARNRLVVRGRGSQLVGPVRGTLSDVHAEAPLGVHCCVADASVVYGADNMANRVLAARRHPVVPDVPDASPSVLVRLDDEASQARYGVGVVDRSGGLELERDDQLEPWAGAVITSHTRPELRVDSVLPAPSPADLDSALTAWPAVLQTDLGDRWLFRYHPVTGPAVERAVAVLGIEVDATPDGWTVRWATEDAPAPGIANPSGWFVLDLSTLDGDDVLAPYPYPAPAPV